MAYGQPAGPYGQPAGAYGQPAGAYGQPADGHTQPIGSVDQLNGGYGQPAGGGYGAWSGGSGQEPWGFGYGATPPPPQQGPGLRRFLVYATVAVLAAGAGAGAAIELSHSSSPSSSSLGSGSLPSNGSGGGLGNGNAGDGGGGGIFGGDPIGSGGTGTGSGGTNTGSGPLNATALAAKVDPGVVDVDSTLEYSDESAEGTGMVISSDGLILTNNHVIDQATSISVTEVTSGRTYPAKVVGYDSTDDVAVLQLQSPSGGSVSGLKTIVTGNSGSVQLGQPVLAIGNAGGRGGLPSTAQGIINAVNRSIQASDNGNAPENLHGMLQTNAPIEEGDSGGPLVNSSGAAIGMDTAANSGDDGSGQSTATTGFAIPIGTALTIAREIIGGQASATVHIGEDGFIGIAAAPNASQCAGSAGSGSQGGGSGSSGSPAGAFVCQVYPNTPAATAGLLEGDVITAVNGTAITSANALTNFLASEHPGDKLTVKFVNANGSTQTTTVTLGELAR